MNRLNNIEVKGKMSNLKKEIITKYNLHFVNLKEVSSNFIQYVIDNKLKPETYEYCSFENNNLVLPLNKNSSWEAVAQLHKKISFNHRYGVGRANEVLTNHYDGFDNITDIWHYYNKPHYCIICNNELKYTRFYRPIVRKLCSYECEVIMKSNRMKGPNSKNPRNLLSKEQWHIIHQQQSISMKQKIKNGTWTPCVTNSWCNSRTVVDDIPFRSSWEAYFYIYKTYIDKEYIEFEKLRISYFSSVKNKDRIYIVDFIDNKNKIVYEIKPNNTKNDITVREKELSLRSWCEENDYKFKFISDEWYKINYFSDIVKDNVKDQEVSDLIVKRLKQFNKSTTTVESITEYNYNGDTYNLHIEDNHNYFAEGFCVSNCHGLKQNSKLADIVYKAKNTKFRIGLTGTLPEDPTAIMSILSCVGVPKRYITTQGLIDRGLATPVNINILKLTYDNDDKALFRHVGNYTKQLQFIKEHQNRNIFISKLATMTSNNGNTVIMCSHVQHMKDIFTELIQQKYPEVQVENKDITGKKSFDFQNKYGIYYIAGSTKSKEREKIIDILKGHSDAILVTNYNLFSTGINAKGIKNIIFASPLKSYTTVTQSIGRAIRLHVRKDVAEIYDIADMFTPKGTFMRQLESRIEKSYKPEGFPIQERIIQI